MWRGLCTGWLVGSLYDRVGRIRKRHPPTFCVCAYTGIVARPKVAPPTKVVTIRLVESAYAEWKRRADLKGVSVGTLLRSKLEEATRA